MHSPAQIPAELQPDYEWLSRESLRWYAHAEALGWVEPTPQQRTAYLQSIRHEQSKTRATP